MTVPRRKTQPTSTGDLRETPRWLVEELRRRYAGGRFTMDLAATKETSKAEAHLGPGSPYAEDALSDDGAQHWMGRCFLNPPWSDIGPWVRRATELRHQYDVLVLVAPDRTSAKWWEEASRECEMVTYIRGRVGFPTKTGSNSSNPEGTAVFIFRKRIVVPKV